MKKSQWILLSGLLAFLLAAGGCGKKGKSKNGSTEDRIESIKRNNWTYFDEGIVYSNPMTGRAEYYDYETKHYMPLCVRANCRHLPNDENCMAVRLTTHSMVGKSGDSWLYLAYNGVGRSFMQCDLDGANEKEVVEFDHSIEDRGCIFTDDSIIVATWEVEMDEEDEDCVYVCGIYRIKIKTGEVETICPATKEKLPRYLLAGVYENKLVYREWTEAGMTIRMVDMKTGEESKSLGDREIGWNDCIVVGEELICTEQLENHNEILSHALVVNLKTGEIRQIMDFGQVDVGPKIYWGEKEKFLRVTKKEGGKSYAITYRYQEETGCQFLREGLWSEELEVLSVKDGTVIGRVGDIGDETLKFDMAVISLEDYLAGKSNWEMLEY